MVTFDLCDNDVQVIWWGVLVAVVLCGLVCSDPCHWRKSHFRHDDALVLVALQR
jgi:hypothetical protein